MAPAQAISRRKFLRRTALALAGGGLTYAMGIEPRWIEVTRWVVRSPSFPPSLRGFRMVHVSDIHRSYFVEGRHVENVVRRVNKLNPDLVVISGDFVAQKASFASSCADILRRLKSRYGAFGAPGNHEYWTDYRKVVSEMERAGIRVLRNAAARLEHNGSPIWVVGLDDLWEGVPNFRFASEGIPEGEPRILAMHNPDMFEELPEGSGDVVLAGHTHGGQFRLPSCKPWIVPSKYGNKYAYGSFQKGTLQMYVSRGIGVTILPLRFLVRPEISLFTLDS